MLQRKIWSYALIVLISALMIILTTLTIFSKGLERGEQQSKQEVQALLNECIDHLQNSKDLILELREENQRLNQLLADIEPVFQIDKNKLLFLNASYPLGLNLQFLTFPLNGPMGLSLAGGYLFESKDLYASIGAGVRFGK